MRTSYEDPPFLGGAGRGDTVLGKTHERFQSFETRFEIVPFAEIHMSIPRKRNPPYIREEIM